MSEKSENSTSLNAADFVMGDPLAKFLVIRRKWSPLQVGLLAYLWAISSSLVIALIGGTLQRGTGYVALVEDYLYLISETALIPTLWGYYTWMIAAPVRVFSELAESKVYMPTAKEIDATRKILGRRWQTPVSLFLAVIIGVVYFMQHQVMSVPFWFATNPILLGIRTALVIVPTGFITWSSVFRYIANTRLFRHSLSDVHIHPLHPDRAGGLRPLGRYALSTTYIIALGGSVVALAEYYAWTHGTFSTAYYYHVALILYFILAPANFFAPLSSAHNAMQRAKDDLILRISRQFNQDFSKAYSELEGSAEELKDHIEKIEQLQRLHSMTNSFPVWPFDIDTIRRFVLTMTSPVFTVAVAVIINVLTNMLTQ